MSEYKFATLCRVARLSAGLSQAELAERMKVAPASIACLETRQKPMRESTLDKMATALGMSTLAMLTSANAIAQRDGVA